MHSAFADLQSITLPYRLHDYIAFYIPREISFEGRPKLLRVITNTRKVYIYSGKVGSFGPVRSIIKVANVLF